MARRVAVSRLIVPACTPSARRASMYLFNGAGGGFIPALRRERWVQPSPGNLEPALVLAATVAVVEQIAVPQVGDGVDSLSRLAFLVCSLTDLAFEYPELVHREGNRNHAERATRNPSLIECE